MDVLAVAMVIFGTFGFMLYGAKSWRGQRDFRSEGKFVILMEGDMVVPHYSDAYKLGGHHGIEGARAHAKQLCITHPGKVYAIAEVIEVISLSHEQLSEIKLESRAAGGRAVGNVYLWSGVDMDSEDAKGDLRIH